MPVAALITAMPRTPEGDDVVVDCGLIVVDVFFITLCGRVWVCQVIVHETGETNATRGWDGVRGAGMRNTRDKRNTGQ